MMRLRLVVGFAFVMVAGSCAWAQDDASSETGKPGGSSEVIANGGLMHTLLATPVMGQPYSAVQVHETRQKLADGTTISHKGHHFVARDSEGRVRVEMRLTKAQDGGAETVMVFVSDPVAHTMTTWFAGPKMQKTATVAKIPTDRKPAVETAPRQMKSDTRPQPVVTTEDLGSQMVEGVPVSDVRTTTVVPVGRSGNDAPITKTREVWISQDMKLTMKEQWEDPRTGERTVELKSFSRAEPDAGLFRAPQGYAVKSALDGLKELEEKLNATQN